MNLTQLIRWVRLRRQGAQSLIIAMTALTFLTAVGGAVTVALVLETRYVSRQRYQTQAFFLARAGVEAAARELLNDSPSADTLADPWAANDAFKPAPLGNGTFEVVCRDDLTGAPRYGIVDEERKLNLNTATPEMLKRLHPVFTDEAVAAIVERRRNRPFGAVSELAPLLDKDSAFLQNGREGAPAGIAALLTVFGDGKVNVNTAPPAVLKAIGLTDEQAARVSAVRAEKRQGFSSLSDFRKAADGASVQGGVALTSSHFTIAAQGHLYTQTSEVRQVVRRDKDGLTVLRFEQVR